ncbi:unnamed protein product [Rotaria sordida]|uniref:Methyltransferase FkbM domain-containing protein n=1 Tax=Rotaria sordida TaxID=392033 RepID=A0A814H178_9BILA|nr:unnamed protein product [Rotaria sordida]CAF1116858.1 unnamed protein product [Rotaria sordida]CAF3599590.1 unnamed protein product [Rotaria sordida]CAF3600917.1 unnamed protein product [Rotaria sordida]
MPTLNRSVDKQTKQSYIGRMLYIQLVRPRRILFVLGCITLLVAANYFYANSLTNLTESVKSRSHEQNVKQRHIIRKIVEIKDRQPSYKLYIYEGYEADVDRKRAQAKLLDNIKLYDKCQQNPKTLVIDVGASLGHFGFYAAACGCQVYMFEVDPIKISLLRMSIKLNSFESRITLVPKAVSDLPSKSQIYMSLNTSSQISRDEIHDKSDVYTVETTNFNQFNFSTDIYLLRVDIEGYEIHVFRGSEKLFRNNLIHHVLFQYTPSGTDRVLQNDLLAYMRDILGGQKFYALHPKQPILYGPIYNEDIDHFYTQHQALNLERDVYVLFRDDDLTIDSKPYEFQSSFD